MTTPALPPGFVLPEDAPPLPEGFVIERRKEPKVTSKTERFLTGLADPLYGAASLAEKTGIPGVIRKGLGIESTMEDVNKARDADYVAPEGVDWMRLGGNVANPVNWVAPEIGVAKALPQAGALVARATAAAPRTTAVVRGAAGGAVGGALQPAGEGESQGENATVGGIFGAVAPPALKVLAKAGGLARNTGQRVVAALPGAIGERAAEAVGTRRTADLLARELPGGAPADVYTPTRPGLQTRSAAVATQDPAVAGLERASRTAGGEHWMPFDEATQGARWNTLESGLQNQGSVDAALAAANKVGSEVPYAKVDPGKFGKEMDDFYTNLQHAKTTPQYHGNPVVRNAIDYVEDTMRNAGQVTPELLHTMRRTVTKGLTGAPGAGEAGVRAASSEPFIIGLAKDMDNVLEKSSGGEWNKWKSAYADAMAAAEGAKADVNIRNKFVDEATGTIRKPGVGGALDTPQVTPAALKQAVVSAGSMKRGPRKGQDILRGQSKSTLEEVLRDLEMQGILQRSKTASTGGSGSDTASNLSQAALMELVLPFSGLGVGRYVQTESNRKAQQAMQRQLAQLLQDPEQLRQFMQQQAQQRLLRSGPAAVPGGGVGVGGAAAQLMGE